MSLDDDFWGDCLIDPGRDGSLRLIDKEEEMMEMEKEIEHDTMCEGSSPKRLKTLDGVGEEEEKRTMEESGDNSSDEHDSFYTEEDTIVLPLLSGLRKDQRCLHKIRKNYLKRRNLRRKFPPDAFVHSENDRNALLDQIVRAARILYLDEAELYFVGDGDDGPFSTSNELESLNSILSSLNFVSITDKYGDLEEVLEWIHNEVCNKVICYATVNSDKYSDDQLYTHFDEASEELLQWAEKKGTTSQLRIAKVSESGRGAVVSEDIGIGDKVLEIPERLIISEDIVQKTDMLCPHLLHYDSIDCDTKSLKFIASRPCIKGQQCYMSYGNLRRSDLVTLYGFLPKGENHHDVFSLGENFPFFYH